MDTWGAVQKVLSHKMIVVDKGKTLKSTKTMAPIGTVDMLGWFSSPEVGIISLIVFLVLSITVVGLCARCRRNSGNAYDVSGSAATQTDGVVAANGTKTSGPTDSGAVAYSTWRNHKDMPASTLERSMTSTD